MRLVFAIWVWMLCASGCATQPTQLLVSVEMGADVIDDPDHLELRVSRESRTPAELADLTRADFPVSFGLTPSGGDLQRDIELELILYDRSGHPIARGAATTRFVENDKVLVSIVLARSVGIPDAGLDASSDIVAMDTPDSGRMDTTGMDTAGMDTTGMDTTGTDTAGTDVATDSGGRDTSSDPGSMDSGTDIHPTDTGTDSPPMDSGTDTLPDSGLRDASCGGSLTRCGTECVNLTNNPNHCGRCDNACPAGTCVSGNCRCSTDAECPGINCCCEGVIASGVCLGAAECRGLSGTCRHD